MDKQEAKFLLKAFRPDGADANLPEFADALRLAVEDRELGEWLANERAMDSQFADALSGAEIPEGLRDEILAVLEFDGSSAVERDSMDDEFIGALASVSAPSGLRDQILTAMLIEGDPEIQDKVVEGNFWKWMSVAAIAAMVAVGAFITLDGGAPGGIAPSHPRIAMTAARVEFAQVMHDNTSIDLNAKGSCDSGLKWLKRAALPVPKHMPVGLDDAVFMGCKDVVLKNGTHASLLCFKKEGVGMVHLFVLNANDVEDFGDLKSRDTISLKACYSCSRTQFNMISWREGDTAFMLLTKAKKEEMMRLF